MPLHPDPELGGVLDRSAPVASAAVLAGIVGRRNHRAQRRLKLVSIASVGVALAAVGVAAGTLTSSTPTGRPLGEAARPLQGSTEFSRSFSRSPAAFGSSRSGAAAAPAGCSAAGCTSPVGEGELTPVFRRSANGVAIRAYLQPGLTGVAHPLSGSAPTRGASRPAATAVLPTCRLAGALVIEVSDAGAVGKLSVLQPAAPLAKAAAPAKGSSAFEVIDASTIGVAEHDPVEVVGIRVDSAVARVSASFADGTVDEMAPEGGWAVLVDHSPSLRSASTATVAAQLVATGADGSVLARASLPAGAAVALPAGCFLPGTPEAGTPKAGTGAGTSTSHG